MKQKKLMLLGGIKYLLPAIEVAHRHGCYVITVDYLPDNIAHKYSDEYHNVSILDKEAVLVLAKKLQIDGILSYAVDPGVVTAAYVAEMMGLPFSCCYETACILQDKIRFRQFLAENDFNVPNAKGYNNVEEAIKDINFFNWPVIVKPTDSAGSKGVMKVVDPRELPKAISHALEESHSGYFIIEDYLEKIGLSSGTESFFVDGALKFNAFYDQYYDIEAPNPFTPSAECWPTNQPNHIQQNVKEQLQRLGNLLQFRTGLFNVEWRVCQDGKVYLMEVSPRAGGNRLAEILNYATDVNIIDAEISKAIGEQVPIINEPQYKGVYAVYVLHSTNSGMFEGVEIDENFCRHYVIEEEIRIEPGHYVDAFTGANTAIGTLFLKFDSRECLQHALDNSNEWLKIIIND